MRNLHIRAEGSDAIVLTWEPPEFPHGNVTSYEVVGEMNKFNLDKEKDYCNERMCIIKTFNFKLISFYFIFISYNNATRYYTSYYIDEITSKK